jgi:beta-glucosidase
VVCKSLFQFIHHHRLDFLEGYKIGHKWSGGNPELLEKVLRDEWGFVSIVSRDAVLGGFMVLNLAIRNGNDLMLNTLPTSHER